MIHRKITGEGLSPVEQDELGVLSPDRAERIDFIRQAAIAFDATYVPPESKNRHQFAWELAQALWDAKPEDC